VYVRRVSLTPDPALESFARHLATLLRIADLSGRVRAEGTPDDVAADVLSLLRRAAGADRASLFDVDHADADDGEPLWVTRVARDVAAADGVRAAVPFQPAHVALLLTPLQTGALEALGDLRDDEPFYARHRQEEPLDTRHAAFAPVFQGGRPVAVVEIARSAGEPFRAEDLAVLERGARSVSASVYSARREATIERIFQELLPELLTPGVAPTSLPERLRAFLDARKLSPPDRAAIGLATTIAELAEHSPAALEMVTTVLAATRKAFVASDLARGRHAR
jgi:GAF domain-containing protein